MSKRELSPRLRAPSKPAAPRDRDRRVHRRDRVRIFGADVDVALGGADRDAGDRHALDQQKGSPSISMRSAKVPLSPSSALQTMYFGRAAGLRHGPPFDAGREAGAAAAAQARLDHLGDDRFRTERQRALEALVAAMRAVILERARVDHAAAREGQAGLALASQGISSGRRAAADAARPQAIASSSDRDVLGCHRTVGDASAPASRPRPSARANRGRASRS